MGDVDITSCAWISLELAKMMVILLFIFANLRSQNSPPIASVLTK